MKKTINGNIEVIRYLLTFLVAALHYWANAYGDADFLGGGYVAVDAFFMISGYFLAVSYGKRSENPFLYTYRKWKNMLVPYVGSILVFVVVESISSPARLPLRLAAGVPDMLGLQMTGFYPRVHNGILWYISAMLIAGLIIAALYRSHQRLFEEILAPIIIVVGYSFLYMTGGELDVIYDPLGSPVPPGTIRGLCGMSAGVLVKRLCDFVAEQPNTKKLKWGLSLAEAIAWGIFVISVTVYGHTKHDFFVLIAVPVILVAAVTRYTLWGEWIDKVGNKLTAFMGKSYTLTMYAFSTIVKRLLVRYTNIETMNKWVSLAIFLVVLTVVSFAITKTTEALQKKANKKSRAA